MKTNVMLSKAATAVITGLLLTSLTACGGDEEDVPASTTSPGRTEQPAGDEPTDTSSEPLSVENVADRCDEFTDLVTTLRAAAPVEVKKSSAKNVTGNGFTYRSAHCTYAYEGDDFSDKNRVDLYVDSAPGDEAGMKKYWDEIASTEPLMAIDGADAATWYSMTGVDAKASARALIGDTLISVRVSVPKHLEGEVFMSKVALADALQKVVALR